MRCMPISVFHPLQSALDGLGWIRGSIEDFMRVLLRNIKTRLFYRGPGEWTECPQEAFDFKQSRLAINEAFDLGFADVEIYEHTPDSSSLAVQQSATQPARLGSPT